MALGLSDNGDVASGAGRLSPRVAEPAAFVHALALELDPGWRRLPLGARRPSAREFVDALAEDGCVRTRAYSLVGLRPDADLLLWSLGPAPDRLEERAAAALGTGAPARYLVVYPFTKSTEWHQLGHETRQGIME